ncbi:MAG: hypothetical protein M1833_001427 [Piccolia ochrophora]|nr:MAG: hypothetical protein M1833_001427 [Piccolia ochrophora]
MSAKAPDGHTNGVSSASTTNPELDVPKLHSLPSEQQDLYLLSFSADLCRHVDRLDSDGICSEQIYLKKELLQLVTLSSPLPTRVIRNNLGRCFAVIFTKGDRKLLYESINDLLAIVNGGKGDKELCAKHAAAHCLGEVFGAAGDSAISLSGHACGSLIRLLKSAQGHAGLRGCVFKSLGRVVASIGSSLDESVARDIWKQARNVASSDKSHLAQACALTCLEHFLQATLYFDNASDFESLKSTVFKALDTPARRVRHVAAATLASALVKSYSEDALREPPPKPKKTKKTAGRQSVEPDDADEIPRSESPAVRKTATRLAFTLTDLLKQLSTHYVRTSTPNRVRAGIALCLSKMLRGLGQDVVELHYLQIADHLLNDVLSHSTITNHRHRLLKSRRYVQIVLEDVVGQQILGETAQLNAAKALINNVLKNFPQVIKERAEPTKYALTGALSALAALMTSLGSAITAITDTCRDGLLQVLQHPSYTVQIATAHCLRSFVRACPQQLIPCVTVCMNSVNRELNLLNTPRHYPRKCVGFANGLAAIISVSPLQPLYGSVDVNARVLSLATGLLKTSTNSELRISGTQIQVAWILIGGLMSLGPTFVKIHLSQLMLLWKNALPKPIARENMAQRSYIELSFLAHVRECALGSILSFLHFNGRLLTTDVSRRLAALLQQTTTFLNSLPLKKTTEDISQRLSPSLQLQDLDLMVRRRVLQCYTQLVTVGPTANTDTLLQSNILTLAVSFFADPESYGVSSLSTSIANSAANFDSIWEVNDNFGFGVTGLVRGFELKKLPGEQYSESPHQWLQLEGSEGSIDRTLISPICGAREHDSVSLYVYDPGRLQSGDVPDPPATEVVNAAIILFAVALPFQAPKVQESIIEQIATFLASNHLQRDPGRKAAMTINVATALLATLKVAMKETCVPPGDLRSPSVEKNLQELLRAFLVHPDQYVRNIAYEALGRLCSSSGNAFTSNEINHLIDIIVSNRDPHARAGCAVALGCIHSQVGGMAAGYHLKTIVGVLMSLSNDPHPTVHFWALEGLSRVANSAGLTFSSYVSSSLGMLAQLYVADTHHDEVSSSASSNIETALSTTVIIAHSVDSLVNVLGPDLQDMSKARDLILTLVGQFQIERDTLVVAEALRSLEHLSLYAAGHMEYEAYVRRLQHNLDSSQTELRDIAIDGLYNLMKRDPEDVLRTAESGLDQQLWLALDTAPEHEGIQNIIRNWLQQTSLTDTSRWVQRCQDVLIMTKSTKSDTPTAPSKKSSAMPELQDEEVAGFAAASDNTKDDSTPAPSIGQAPLKWQVRTFAVSCLSDLIAAVGRDMLGSDQTKSSETELQLRVADIIRMAFSASTSNVVELRIWGLRIIDQILKIFGKTPDPDFSEASLLEQYQAQISSALTPAFAADSSPELAAEAVNVCAAFISTGIVTDVDRMGRILKLLVSALDSFSRDSETSSIGDLKGLSSNAQVMVRMSVFSAWAELQVASGSQQYLVDVVKPHIARLTPLWLSSLREFARLRFEPDISLNVGPPSPSDSLDTIYAALYRQTLLKFYQDSWLNLVDAIASLIEQDSEFAFEALDGKTEPPTPTGAAKPNDIRYRDEPVAFFFVLFGITFEALVGRPGHDSLATKGQTLEILLALKKILHPSVSGQAIYQDIVFSETMELFDRLILTEGLDVQMVIVQIARDLCLSHPSARFGPGASAGGENLSDDIDQLFELTRIIVLVLAGLMPGLNTSKTTARHSLSDEAVSLVALSLNALVDASGVFPSVIKTDLHACIFHIFAHLLGTGACQATVVPQSLPTLQRFIQGLVKPRKTLEVEDTIVTQVRGCLQRFLAIFRHAQKRETETSLACVKNTLLASTILLVGSMTILPANEALVERFLDEVADCLDDRMTAQVAANCTRSILLSSPPPHIPRHLLPLLLSHLTHPPDPTTLFTTSRPIVARTLTLVATTLPRDSLPTYLTTLLLALLHRAHVVGGGGDDDGPVFRETAARILELAGVDQQVFRMVVGRLGEAERALLEKVLREGGAGKGRDDGREEEGRDQVGRGPAIELRMDFGGL